MNQTKITQEVKHTFKFPIGARIRSKDWPLLRLTVIGYTLGFGPDDPVYMFAGDPSPTMSLKYTEEHFEPDYKPTTKVFKHTETYEHRYGVGDVLVLDPSPVGGTYKVVDIGLYPEVCLKRIPGFKVLTPDRTGELVYVFETNYTAYPTYDYASYVDSGAFRYRTKFNVGDTVAFRDTFPATGTVYRIDEIKPYVTGEMMYHCTVLRRNSPEQPMWTAAAADVDSPNDVALGGWVKVRRGECWEIDPT